MQTRIARLLWVLTLSGLGLAASGDVRRSDHRDPGVAAADPIAQLQARIEAGTTSLRYDSVYGYLPAVLEALDIPLSSQTLVFSRTSLQVARIAPWTPRALYFNDDVYVGWVQEGPIIEIASMDPDDGAMFYTLTQRADGPQTFRRETTNCLQCHESRITEQLPGLIMRSILTDRYGYPIIDVHAGSTRDDTPLASRWGGWYVTGTHGAMTHSGNVHASELYEEIAFPSRYLSEFDLGAGSNTVELESRFDVTRYLTPHSDIVALMVLTHQVRVHNLISLVKTQGSRAAGGPAAQKGALRFSLEGAAGSSVAALDRLFRGLLFVGDPGLDGPVVGTSDFASEFPTLGPADSRGRSLRDFDLESRLFTYPLSFLVHSESFQALPAFARNYISDGLSEVPTTDDLPEAFAHLASVDRGAMLEILVETIPDFADRIAQGGGA